MPNAPRIELYPISQRVQVHVDGTLTADSINTIELHERGYLPRHYFPREDVRMDLLSVSETTTYCPFKGSTVYFSMGDIQDIAWSYEQPIASMEAIAGRVAFYKELRECSLSTKRTSRQSQYAGSVVLRSRYDNHYYFLSGDFISVMEYFS